MITKSPCLYLPALFVVGSFFFFISCEKNETIEQTDGNSFCPLGFRYYLETGSFEGCGFEFISAYNPVFSTGSEGTVVKIPLKQHNTPFIAGDPAPNTPDNFYHGMHRTHTSSKFQLVFDKVNMTEGTRFSLYFGKTTPAPSGSQAPYMGVVAQGIPPGPSLQHDWQIYIQHEINGTYTLGYIADGVAQTVQSNIADFTTADFQADNQGGKSIFRATLKDGAPLAEVASFDSESLNLPAIPDDYFGAFGFNILESLLDDCTVRPVVIQLKKYVYQSSTAAGNYEDNFACNTIWLY